MSALVLELRHAQLENSTEGKLQCLALELLELRLPEPRLQQSNDVLRTNHQNLPIPTLPTAYQTLQGGLTPRQ